MLAKKYEKKVEDGDKLLIDVCLRLFMTTCLNNDVQPYYRDNVLVQICSCI